MPISKTEENLKKVFCKVIRCAFKIILNPQDWENFKDKMILVDIPVPEQSSDLGDRLLRCCKEICEDTEYGWAVDDADPIEIKDSTSYDDVFEWFMDLL